MSTQICKIKGYGYKFDYDEPIFSFIPNREDDYYFLDVIGKNFSYYQFRDWQCPDKKDKEPLLAVVDDGMCGEYRYVLYIEEVHYIENTHGDNYWEINPRFNNYVKEYAQKNIETLLQRKLDTEPQMFSFKHYS